jgi:tetratricopeptide (TPR) repeat protein
MLNFFKNQLPVFIIILSFSSIVFAQTTSETPPPVNLSPVKSEVEKLVLLFTNKQFDEAIELSAKIIEKYPTSGDIYTIRGLSYLQKGEKEKALSDFSKSLEVNLSEKLQTTARKMKIVTSYDLKKYEITIKEATILIEKNSKDPKDFMFRGWSYFYTNDYKSAVADFDFVLNMDAKIKGIRRFRAAAHNKLGNYDKAIEDINDELKLDPTAKSEVFQIRATAYRKLGKTESAEADEKKYEELNARLIADRQNTQQLNDLIVAARKFFDQGDLDQAIKTYTEILNATDKNSKNLFSYYFNRGRCYFEKGLYDEAFNDYNDALKLQPDFAFGYIFRGEVYLLKKQIDSAIADFNKSIELNAKDILAFRRRAEAFYLKKDFKAAIKDCDEVIKRNPKYRSALYYRAASYLEENNFNAALADASEYITLGAQDVFGLRLRAKIYRKLGEETLAKADEDKALTLEQIQKVVGI